MEAIAYLDVVGTKKPRATRWRDKIKRTDPERYKRFLAGERLRKRGYMKRMRESGEVLSLHVVFPKEDAAAIKRLAKDNKVSMAEAVRTLVTWGIEGEFID